MIQSSKSQRRNFEKKWYDNNFFDDGYHFRYVSRTTGKIIDQQEGADLNVPQRAIPKASRQIRGIANLLLKPRYVPVAYPEKVYPFQYPDPNQFQQAYLAAKERAKREGLWLENEWKEQDLKGKLTQMVLLSSKHYISYLQVWRDVVEEKIRIEVFDAFDIYLSSGSIKEIYDSPFLIKATPKLISEIKANENFNKEQVKQIHPDNKYASSEIKDAYIKARYGTEMNTDRSSTLIQKEAFIKEYLSENNVQDIIKASPDILKGKKFGDLVMRHVFSAGGIWLLDEYLDLDEYPFVDFRMEPGAIYGTPLIERFIPANKSLDIAVSRVERYANTMVTGTWLTRKGENFTISNVPGGQKLEYETTPPVQGQMANIPPFMFNYIGLLNSFIEEQGASVSALAQVPTGVTANIAIESLKASEADNLTISYDQLQRTVKRIGETMIKIGSKFVDPKSVFTQTEGNPEYFDMVGEAGAKVRQEIGEELPQNTFVIKGDDKIDIEVESGLGFTMEGKRQTMQQIINYMVQLAGMGVMTVDAIKVVTQKFFETFGFGATQEFMDALDSGNQTMPLNEDQVMQMKIAMMEVAKDLGLAGESKDQQLVDSTKVGMMEALKDLQKEGGNAQ